MRKPAKPDVKRPARKKVRKPAAKGLAPTVVREAVAAVAWGCRFTSDRPYGGGFFDD